MTTIRKFIVDTNILLSGLLVKNSIPSIAVDKARREGVIIFSDSTFLEFETVLFRKKFDRYFSADERLLIIERFHREGKFYPVISKIQVCRDSKDDKFLELGFDAEATCIITGDEDLLVLHPFKDIPVLSPNDFAQLVF